MNYDQEIQSLKAATGEEDYFERGLQTFDAHCMISERAKALRCETVEKLLEEIEENKDWRHLLRISVNMLCSKLSCERFGSMMAHILEEGNEELFEQLCVHVKRRTDVMITVMDKLVQLNVKWSSVYKCLDSPEHLYEVAAIKADNVDLLHDYLQTCRASTLAYSYMGQFYAKRCMDLVGYEEYRTRNYLSGAFDSRNLQSIDWLLSKSEATRKIIVNDYVMIGPDDYIEDLFATEIIRTKRIVLNEKEWRVMQERNPELYKQLSNDV